MSYQTVPTVATGDSWTAAQHNTYIRDNFTALWPYTDAGDIAYATSSTTLSKVGIGTAGQALVSTGTVPEWQDYKRNKGVVLQNTTGQTFTTAKTSMIWESATMNNYGMWVDTSPAVITIPETAIYRLDGTIHLPSTTIGATLSITDGTNETIIQKRVIDSNTDKHISFSYTYKFVVGTSYEFQIISYNEDATADLTGNIALIYTGPSL